jgi:hypothetical protein
LIEEFIMDSKLKKKLSGAALAMAAAGLVGMTGATPAIAAGGATTDMVHCYGVNTCKGHNDCKTAENNCAGHATCKGHGFVAMPSKSCGDIGGKTEDDWKGSVVVADLAHCYNVNICGGHNDCKTADNACAGHATCKGTGFVAMSGKACGDVGGKVGS